MLSMIEDQIGITQLNLLFKNLAQHFKQMGYVDYYLHLIQKKICFIQKKKKILIYLIIFKCIILLSPMFKYLVSSSRRCFNVNITSNLPTKKQYETMIFQIYTGGILYIHSQYSKTQPYFCNRFSQCKIQSSLLIQKE